MLDGVFAKIAAFCGAVGEMTTSAHGEVRSANLPLHEPSRLSACEGNSWLWADISAGATAGPACGVAAGYQPR
jgi:hypothetical protein